MTTWASSAPRRGRPTVRDLGQSDPAVGAMSTGSRRAPSQERPLRNRPLLFVLQGPEQGAIFSVPHGGLVGRDARADVALRSDTVSREHAQLTVQDGEFYVEDLGSLSGTFVNERRVTHRLRVEDGDYLHFGATVVKFSLVDELEQNALRTLYELTLRDPLTRLYNRRYFDERLRSEFSFAARQHTPIAVLILDLDHFKRVNDRHGHQVGDIVLKLVSASISRIMRPEDVLARYGGEEFVVISRNTSLRNAEILGERIRRCVQELSVELEHGTLRVTASVGVTSTGLRAFPESAEALVSAADDALYRAKQAGRNRVIGAHPAGTADASGRDQRTLPPSSSSA